MNKYGFHPGWKISQKTPKIEIFFTKFFLKNPLTKTPYMENEQVTC